MEIKIVSTKENPLLKRKEVSFTILLGSKEKTPERLKVKKALADALLVKEEAVFVKKMRTKTGTNITQGLANVYQDIMQAQVVEPEYIRKRNSPEKPKEEAKA